MLAFRLEMKKARHMRYWLMALALATGQGLWFSWVVSKSQAEQLRQGYMGALQQFPVINTIVMPVLIAVLVSRMCDMEHCGHTFKQLFTMQRPAALFNAKLALCAVYVAAVTVMQGAVILLAGHMRGFLDVPPAEPVFGGPAVGSAFAGDCAKVSQPVRHIGGGAGAGFPGADVRVLPARCAAADPCGLLSAAGNHRLYMG